MFFSIQFDFGRKIQFIGFMLRVFTAHFSPVKCSKTISTKGPNPWLYIGGYSEWGLYKMPQERALYLYLKHQLSAASELSPNKQYIPVGYYHASNPLTWQGYSRANVPYFIFLHCPLSAGKMKCVAFDIQRQIWQYKVKHDRWWRKPPWF